MKPNYLKNIIALFLALFMILPAGFIVSGDVDSNPVLATTPGMDAESSSLVQVGNAYYQVWIEGGNHDARLKFSMSQDGETWSPEIYLTTIKDFTPMNVNMLAGTDTLHITWLDGLSKTPSTGYMAVDFEGEFSRAITIQGDNPSMDVLGNQVAIATTANGQLNVHLSQNPGKDFQSQRIFDGLSTSINSISLDDGLEIVASAGIRDQDTGQLFQRGLYFASYNGAWSSANKITDAGAVKELALNSESIIWTEVSSNSIDKFEMKVLAPGIFGEKTLVSSDDFKSQPAPISLAPSKLPPKKWTYICYLDADNNLDSFGWEDMNEMEEIGSDADVNMLVLFDGDTFSGDDSHAYYIDEDTINPPGSTEADIISTEIPLTDINPGWGTELNMGDPQVAIDWVNYVYTNYPADKYIWDMWDHGGSWLYGMCSDDTSGDDLTMQEVRLIYETLRTDTGKIKLFDVAGYDECLMSDVSNAYDEVPYIDYICNSEDSIAGDGWEYNLVLDPIVANPDMNGEEAAFCIFQAYVDFYGTSGGLTTMSIINSTLFYNELMPLVNSLAQKGIHDITANRAALQTAANSAADWQGYTWQKDLIHFCENIVAGLPGNEIRSAAQDVLDAGEACAPGTQYGDAGWDGQRAIIIHNQNANENGITIYIASAPYDNLFDTMTVTDTNWDEFYKVLWGADADQPNIEPGVVISSPSDGGTVIIDSIATITGTASDSDGTVLSVDVAVGNEHWAPATGTNAWSFNWDTTGWDLGLHYLQARSFDGQDYSDPYIIEVQMVDVSSNGTVNIQLPEYPMEASVLVTVKDTDLNTDVGVQTTTITVDSSAEPAGESLLLTETGGDTSVFEGTLTISGTDGAGILWVNPADTITATYNDADYGGTGPNTLTDTATVDGVSPGPPTALTVEWFATSTQEAYAEDFEGDGSPTFAELGWDPTGASSDWELDTPQGLGSPADPSSAYSGSYAIGNDMTGLGAVSGEYESDLLANTNYIESPVIDCTGYTSCELEFMRFLGIESSTFDHASIQVSNDGVGWSMIWDHAGGSFTDPDWTQVNYDISAVADNQPTVYIRFDMGPTDSSVEYPGWNIDDLLVRGTVVGGTDDNYVNWTLSADDGAGDNDVSYYNVYRANNAAGPWDAGALIDSVPAGTNNYIDLGMGEFDGINWFYVIRAEDMLGNEEMNTVAVPEVPLFNVPPSVPNTPAPSNGAIGIGLNPTISCKVADPNGDVLDVHFYDASGPTLIGTDSGVASGAFASVNWNGLSADTTYNWYAVADDGEFTTNSPTWSFTTMDTTPPGPTTDLTVEWWGVTSQTWIDEDFSGGVPPAGWIQDGPSAQWTSQASSNAGGTSPEARFAYVSSTDVWHLYAGPFDTSGLTTMDLQWQNMVNDWGTEATHLDLIIQTSTDATTWTDAGWTYTTGSGDMPASLETLVLNTADVGSSTFYVSWTCDGYAYDVDYWYIDDVLLTSTGGGTTDDNWLNWTLSADDGAGVNDVDHYNIYRSDVQTGPWDGAHIIDTVPAGTDTYMDFGMGEFDGTIWWYVVRAEDIWGNEEMNTVAVPEISSPPITFDIPVAPVAGWNFISFPILASGSPDLVLNDMAGDGTTKWDVIKWYNPQDAADPWKTYRFGAPNNDLLTIDNCFGLWVHITVPGNNLLTVQGAVPVTTDIQLYTGWNLVGYPSATPSAADITLPGLADMIAVYDGGAPYLITDETDLSLVTMSDCNAYWVHVTVDCIWAVNY